MITEIKLTGGHFTIVDNCDLEMLLQRHWYCKASRTSRENYYAYTTVNRHTVLMHRLILAAPKGIAVDHIDGNGLNNRRENLRLCTSSQNNSNRIGLRSSCGFRGVEEFRPRFFRAYVSQNNKKINVGIFSTAVEAAVARDRAAIEHYGEFARLNFPDYRSDPEAA